MPGTRNPNHTRPFPCSVSNRRTGGWRVAKRSARSSPGAREGLSSAALAAIVGLISRKCAGSDAAKIEAEAGETGLGLVAAADGAARVSLLAPLALPRCVVAPGGACGDIRAGWVASGHATIFPVAFSASARAAPFFFFLRDHSPIPRTDADNLRLRPMISLHKQSFCSDRIYGQLVVNTSLACLCYA